MVGSQYVLQHSVGWSHAAAAESSLPSSPWHKETVFCHFQKELVNVCLLDETKNVRMRERTRSTKHVAALTQEVRNIAQLDVIDTKRSAL